MVIGPYVSVRPYTCTMRKFSALIRASRVGEGGAAATMAVTGRSRRCARGWLMTISWTVGAPL